MTILKKGFVHGFLILFILMWLMPVYFAVVAASHTGSSLMHAPLPTLPGSQLWRNISYLWQHGIAAMGHQALWKMMLNSFIMAAIIALGKMTLAFFSAYMIIYFRLPGKGFIFFLIFTTMMLPIEVRIVPTFQIVAAFSWLNTYTGLTLPLMASATATFLFRQFFKTIPADLVDAARLDGAGPWRFCWDILLPLSATQIAALFIILFVYGWNQYLWPLLATTEDHMTTIVMGLRYLANAADQIPQWHYIMSTALLAMLPPCIVVLAMHRFFNKGVMH